MINIDDIPAPVGDVTIEHANAFRQVLEHLFATYPPDDTLLAFTTVYGRSEGKPAEFCRAKAVTLTFGTRDDVRSAAHWACDTGVPNEEILSAYMLIFG